MTEIKLRYLGKKSPFKINNPKLSKPVDCNATVPVWVPAHDAIWLMEANPLMFQRLEERDLDEPDREEEGEEMQPKIQNKYPSQMNVGELIQEGFKYNLDFTIDTPDKKEMRERIAEAKVKAS